VLRSLGSQAAYRPFGACASLATNFNLPYCYEKDRSVSAD